MAHFNIESECTTVLKVLDAPIANGPLMRWQKKQGDTSGAAPNHASVNSTINTSTCKTTPMKLSASQINIHNGCKSSPTQKTPGVKRTPSKTRTPGKAGCAKTPTSAAQSTCSDDRFIPNRAATQFELGHYRLMGREDHLEDETSEDGSSVVSTSTRDYQRGMSENLNGDLAGAKIIAYSSKAPTAREGETRHPMAHLFVDCVPSIGHTNSLRVLYSSHKNPGSSKKHTARHIPQMPERVLDAPDLLDDYYLNLLSWSHMNIVAVALGSRVYLWNAIDGNITQLVELEEGDGYISSVSWAKDDHFLALGMSNGEVHIYDAEHSKRMRVMAGHPTRVGSLAWNAFMLSSGSRTGAIHQHDVRLAEHHTGTLRGHTQEVCGLQWSPDGRHLASGGNDNVLNIWPAAATTATGPVHSLTVHQAAVKAVAWCPWQNNLLASGGGTADRCIKFWNVNSGSCIKSVDTKSQVCSILWSKEYKELISGHGFTDNQLIIWRYPSMDKVTELTGHTGRVLQLAMSPDGSTVMSAAADESLRLWKCFATDPGKGKGTKAAGATLPSSIIRQSIR